MSGWQLVAILVVAAFVVSKFLGKLESIRTELVSLREHTAKQLGAHEGIAPMSATLDKVANTLDALSQTVKYPYLLAAYSLEDLAWQRQRCAFLYGKINRRVQQVLADGVPDETASGKKIAEEDKAQFEYQYRKLTLMLQANQRVAAGVELIGEARERIEKVIGKEPFAGAEMGSGVEYWKAPRLIEKLLLHGMTFPDDEIV